MADHALPAQETITLAGFIEQAAHVSGGIEVLRRRLGISRASIQAMSVSDTPMLKVDATALFEAFGLSTNALADSWA